MRVDKVLQEVLLDYMKLGQSHKLQERFEQRRIQSIDSWVKRYRVKLSHDLPLHPVSAARPQLGQCI